MLIDDFPVKLFSPLGSKWRGASDRVMGGNLSQALRVMLKMAAARLAGDVRKENGGVPFKRY